MKLGMLESGESMNFNDRVTNASTALMAVRDLATYYDIPINIHFADHYIHVIVGFGTPYQTRRSWYSQDLYQRFSNTDEIYLEIKHDIERLKSKH